MTTLPKTLRIANLQIQETALSLSGSLRGSNFAWSGLRATFGCLPDQNRDLATPSEQKLDLLSLWRRYESLCPVWFRQAVKFFSVGVLNTVLDVGLYLVFTHWLGILAAWPVVAKAISYGAGVLNSFYWNKLWTFKSEASTLTTLAPFVLANLAATAINAGVMYLGLTLFNLPENVSLVLATGVTFLWNFTISKFVIFKK